MKRILKVIGIIILVSIIVVSIISCDSLFNEKDCTHCNGTGQAHLTYSSAVSCGRTFCADDWPDCGTCGGKGKLASW